VFLFVVVIQLFFYVFLFGKFSFTKIEKIKQSSFPISVIIASRNEVQNLKENLPSILNQKYPNFEVIVINDASTDESNTILELFQNQYKHLKVITLENTNSYSGNKKNAISKGIDVASNNNLLFTDADCRPVSENWITEMTSLLSDKKEIVLGYGGYQKIDNSFLNILIRYETLLTAIQYFSYAKIGIPYMGVGRNLAYKKELFQKNSGFENHKHIKSGDDDLLINQISTQSNTEICFTKESFTISKPKTSFTSWIQQKRRHISTATSYKPIHQFLLVLFFLSQFLFWCLAIILLIFSFKWQLVTILVAIRLISQYIAIRNSATKLDEKDIVLFTPFLDFLLVFTQIGLFIINLIYKPKHW
jgi:glycosyltransferase involved in cell wall biosynthesis